MRVRVVTNSLASTDVGAVHAGYKSSRRELLEGGVELFEMMPRLDADAVKSSGFSFSGSSGASLHAKMFVFDRQRVFIGSMNLDPRSVQINTEVGLLIDSPELAARLHGQLLGSIASACYAVVLEPRNAGKPAGRKELAWIEDTDGEKVRYDKEPQTTFLAAPRRRLHRPVPGGFATLAFARFWQLSYGSCGDLSIAGLNELMVRCILACVMHAQE